MASEKEAGACTTEGCRCARFYPDDAKPRFCECCSHHRGFHTHAEKEKHNEVNQVKEAVDISEKKQLPFNFAPNFNFKDMVNMAGLKVGTDMNVSGGSSTGGSNFNRGGSSSASASSQGGAGGAASCPGGPPKTVPVYSGKQQTIYGAFGTKFAGTPPASASGVSLFKTTIDGDSESEKFKNATLAFLVSDECSYNVPNAQHRHLANEAWAALCKVCNVD